MYKSIILVLAVLVFQACTSPQQSPDNGETSTTNGEGQTPQNALTRVQHRILEKYQALFGGTVYADCSDDLTDHLFQWGKELENGILDLTPMSAEAEMAIGADLHRQIEAEFDLLTTHPALFELRGWLNQMVKGVEREGITYQVWLVRSADVNAFSIAGGHIYFTTAMIDFATREELQFVLGHEIAHIDKRHVGRKMQRLKAASDLLGETGEALASLGLLLTAPFGQIDEYEADKHGAHLCDLAKFSPMGGLSFFTKLSGQEQYDPLNKLIRTHPYSAQRRECLATYIDSEL